MHLITSRLLFVAVLSSFSISSFSQSDTLFYFLDKNGKSCQSKNAAYIGFGIKENGQIRFTNYTAPGGLPVMEGHFTDSTLTEKNGYYKSFDPPGYISEEGVYKKNSKEGYWLRWNKNGQVEDSEFYQHGYILLSIQLHYNQFGLVVSRILDNEVQAKKELTLWYDNGNIKMEALWIQNQGDRYSYRENGKLTTIDTYEKGLITQTKFYKEDGEQMNEEEVATLKKEVSEKTTEQLKKTEEEKANNPSYPGGSDAFWDYIRSHIKIPHSVFYQHPDQPIKIIFTLNETGHAVDVKIGDYGNSDMQRKLINVLTYMPPWNMKGKKSYGPLTYYLILQGTLSEF